MSEPAAPDPTKEIKVTNSTTVPIVVMIPTTSTATTDANGTMIYGQNLEILNAVEGGTTVDAGKTSTFVLNQTYTDPTTGKPAYSTIYDLLPSTSNWYSPVGNIGVIQSFTTPPSYPAQTVTAASATAFANTAKFVQTISAYPTSGLATSYQTALTNAQNKASAAANGSTGSSDAVAGAISTTVDAWFKTTKTYQNVTMESVVAVQSYYATFPFVWAEYKATGTTTYYLYSSNGTATSFVGTISLAPPATIDVSKANAGYTLKFTPASNGSDTTNVDVNTADAKSLTYTNSLFVDDVTSDVPAVAIRGSFQIKSTFSGNSGDTGVIPVLTGTVNGKTCIGFDSPQLSNNPASTFWDTLFNPKNSAQIFQSIMELGGALMFLVFIGQSLYGIYKWARGLAADKKPTTEELLNEQLDKLQKSQKETLDDLVKKLTNDKGQAPATEADAADAVKSQTDIVDDNESLLKIKSGLDTQAKSLQDLAEFEEDMSAEQLGTLESIGTKLEAAAKVVAEADPTALKSVVEAQATQLKEIADEFDTLQTEVGDVISEQVKTQLAENAQAIEEVAKEAAEEETSEEDITSDEAPETDPIEAPE